MAGYPDYGSLSDFLNQQGGADVAGGAGTIDLGSLLSMFGQGGGGGGGLGSLFGQGGGSSFIPGLGSLTDLLGGIQGLTQGGAGGDVKGAMDITGGLVSLIPGIGQIAGPALAGLGNIIGPMIQGLPASTKPNMFANYLQGQGGIAGDLGNLIAQAQQAAGSGSGVLSQSGPGAYNPEFESGLLEALTGQSVGSQTAPPSGGAKQGVTMNFNPAQNILQQLGLGAGGAGYTAQQLSTPQATKAIMSATKGGDVGTGQKMGAKKIQQYLPAVEQALAKAGIVPGGGGGGGSTGTGPGGDTVTGPGSQLNLQDLLGLLNLIGGQGGNNTLGNLLKYLTQQPGGDTGQPSWSLPGGGGGGWNFPGIGLLNPWNPPGWGSSNTNLGNESQYLNLYQPPQQPHIIQTGTSFNPVNLPGGMQLPKA